MADPLDPITFVHKIKAAVSMPAKWEDEQTAGTAPESRRGLHRHAPQVVHVYQRCPHRLARPCDVQTAGMTSCRCSSPHQAPATNSGLVQFAAPLFYGESMEISNATLPPDPIQQIPTYRAALAAYEKLPEVRVLFDNGAGAGPDGNVPAGYPYPAYEHFVRPLPDPGHRRRERGISGPVARLATSPAATPEVDSFTWNRRRCPRPTTRPRTPPAGGCGAMRPIGTGTGSRTRPAPRSRT